MHRISPPTEIKVTLGVPQHFNQRPVPAPAGVSARHGRGGRWPVALGHRP